MGSCNHHRPCASPLRHELKKILGDIGCQSYPDANGFWREQNSFEQLFMCYAETSECSTQTTWGHIRQGRLPHFLYDDERSSSEVFNRDERTGAFVTRPDIVRALCHVLLSDTGTGYLEVAEYVNIRV